MILTHIIITALGQLLVVSPRPLGHARRGHVGCRAQLGAHACAAPECFRLGGTRLTRAQHAGCKGPNA